jgi:hypothetical protein
VYIFGFIHVTSILCDDGVVHIVLALLGVECSCANLATSRRFGGSLQKSGVERDSQVPFWFVVTTVSLFVWSIIVRLLAQRQNGGCFRPILLTTVLSYLSFAIHAQECSLQALIHTLEVKKSDECAWAAWMSSVQLKWHRKVSYVS